VLDAGVATEMVDAVQTYIDSIGPAKALVLPFVRLHEDAPVFEGVDEVRLLPLRHTPY
jgi:hypothetical protein